ASALAGALAPYPALFRSAPVARIATAAYADYYERPEVFAERLALFPDGCRVCVADARIAGYLLAHPGRFGAPPLLDSLLGAPKRSEEHMSELQSRGHLVC